MSPIQLRDVIEIGIESLAVRAPYGLDQLVRLRMRLVAVEPRQRVAAFLIELSREIPQARAFGIARDEGGRRVGDRDRRRRRCRNPVKIPPATTIAATPRNIGISVSRLSLGKRGAAKLCRKRVTCERVCKWLHNPNPNSAACSI